MIARRAQETLGGMILENDESQTRQPSLAKGNIAVAAFIIIHHSIGLETFKAQFRELHEALVIFGRYHEFE